MSSLLLCSLPPPSGRNRHAARALTWLYTVGTRSPFAMTHPSLGTRVTLLPPPLPSGRSLRFPRRLTERGSRGITSSTMPLALRPSRRPPASLSWGTALARPPLPLSGVATIAACPARVFSRCRRTSLPRLRPLNFSSPCSSSAAAPCPSPVSAALLSRLARRPSGPPPLIISSRRPRLARLVTLRVRSFKIRLVRTISLLLRFNGVFVS